MMDHGGYENAAKSTPNLEGKGSRGVLERCSGASDRSAEEISRRGPEALPEVTYFLVHFFHRTTQFT